LEEGVQLKREREKKEEVPPTKLFLPLLGSFSVKMVADKYIGPTMLRKTNSFLVLTTSMTLNDLELPK